MKSPYTNKTLLELAQTTTMYSVTQDMIELMNTLKLFKNKNDPVVFYIFDEHNELYNQYGGKTTIDLFPILNNFTRWTGLTSGVNN